jgi:aminoglycoside 6'-N-acetyltransferase
MSFHFEKLTLADLPLMTRWLNEPVVNYWFGRKPYTLEMVHEEYLPVITGEEPTLSMLIYAAQQPIGYIQSYRFADFPEHDQHVGAGENSAGIDLFIGEENFRHHGFGAVILQQFIRENVFDKKENERCFVDPEPENLSAIRMYEKCGFHYWRTLHVPGQPSPGIFMQLRRDELIP